MDIILMRHGRAAPRGSHEGPDGERPLTGDGSRRVKQSLAGLRRAVPHINRVLTSPLLRARQTAELVAEGCSVPMKELAALAPGGDPLELTHWLVRQGDDVLLLVGHEPDLGQLASWYLTGSTVSFLPMKKGAICMLHFEGKPAAAQGELRLLLTAGQLRRMA